MQEIENHTLGENQALLAALPLLALPPPPTRAPHRAGQPAAVLTAAEDFPSGNQKGVGTLSCVAILFAL